MAQNFSSTVSVGNNELILNIFCIELYGHKRNVWFVGGEKITSEFQNIHDIVCH